VDAFSKKSDAREDFRGMLRRQNILNLYEKALSEEIEGY
jgi:hypothetical protein